MKHLLVKKNVGALFEMPKDKPSEFWMELEKRFSELVPGDRFDFVTWIRLPCYDYAREDIVNGVPFTWELAGPGGADFQLIKFPDVPEEQIKKAISKLRESRDVVRLSVLRIEKLIPFSAE